MRTVQIKSNIIGKINELHGVNCAPYSTRGGSDQPVIDHLFGYAGIPRSRLHDVCSPWGWGQFVDIPNIFPNFDADVNDPASYNFYFTDEYIGCIIKTGAQIVNRLGVSIEWFSKKIQSHPPKDFQKWAEICEHVIRHYNEGWADGFHYGIEYWEIWNEPENPPMWQGTKAEYFELYRVSSMHLKKCFPDLKIGGYGGCGFYAAFRPEMNDFYKSFLTWYQDFLTMVKENGCPLDFYSWHIYTNKIEEIRLSQEYVRKYLDDMGFTHTESHLNEWNYGGEGQAFDKMDTIIGASFDAAAMITMQECGIDLGMFYCADGTMAYSALTDLRTKKLTAPAHVFSAFSRLFKAHNRLKLVKDGDVPHVLAARDGEVTCCLISSYGQEPGQVELRLEDTEGKTVYCYELTDARGFVLKNTVPTEEKLLLDCDPKKVIYLAVGSENDPKLNDYLF